MIVVTDARGDPTLLETMYRQRAKMFRDRLNWDVHVTDDAEIDEYDTKHNPVYLLSVAGDKVFGSLRLMPTTGPCLLDQFVKFHKDYLPIVHPSIWEISRFCPMSRLVVGRLVDACRDFAAGHDISTLIGNFTPATKRLCERYGAKIEVLHEAKYPDGSTGLLGFLT